MKYRSRKILAAAVAVLLVTGGIPASFAQTGTPSRGAGVIAAAAAADQNSPGEAAGDSSVTEETEASEGAAPAGDGQETAADEEVILQTAENPEPAAGQSFQGGAGGSGADTSVYGPEDYINNEVLVMDQEGNVTLQTFASEAELTAGLAALAEDENVALYQPNFTYESETVSSGVTDDTYAKHQWALENDGSFQGYRKKVSALKNADVDAQKAWEYYTPKRDVVIALVDTGVETSHSELSGSFWVNEDEIPGNGKDDDGNGYIDDVNGWNFFNSSNQVYTGSGDAHGTHCAGTISAAKDNGQGISGLADYSNIKIMTVKALGGADGSGTTLSLTRAIKYAEENGASICSLSLGTDSNDRLLYQAMKNSGMLFVVAAGNGDSAGNGINIDVRPSYPASYDLDNIITVGNLVADGTLHASSDYGAVSVDLAAPGTDIISTTVNGKYAYMTGTSMATPFVSAAAAMVYSANESLTLADTRRILLDTVKIDTALKNKVATGGILDCGSAVAFAVTGDTQDGDDAAADTKTPASEQGEKPSQQAVPAQPSRDFGSSPFTVIQLPSGSLSVWTGWSSRGFPIDLPQFWRIIWSMSDGSV